MKKIPLFAKKEKFLLGVGNTIAPYKSHFSCKPVIMMVNVLLVLKDKKGIFLQFIRTRCERESQV
jgi:hypothetical protein